MKMTTYFKLIEYPNKEPLTFWPTKHKNKISGELVNSKEKSRLDVEFTLLADVMDSLPKEQWVPVTHWAHELAKERIQKKIAKYQQLLDTDSDTLVWLEDE